MSFIQVAAAVLGLLIGFALESQLPPRLKGENCGTEHPIDATLAKQIDDEVARLASAHEETAKGLNQSVVEFESLIAGLETKVSEQEKQLQSDEAFKRALDLIYKTPQQRKLAIGELEFGSIKNDIAAKCLGLKPAAKN